MRRLLQNERLLVCVTWELALPAAVALLVHLVLHALATAQEFQGIPVNGAFQLFNPLRRLAAGQTPGVDFQVFHGLGVPLLHYPVFRLLGGDLHASEVARHLVSALLFPIATGALLRSWKTPWPGVLLLSVGLSAAADALGLGTLAGPGNSLLGARSTFPLLVAALAFACAPGPEPPAAPAARRARLVAALSVALAASILLGTEQGLAACGATVAALVLTPLGAERPRERLLVAGGVVLGTAVACLLLLLVVTGGHPLEPLRYALRDVPADQIWYFGVPPNAFVFRWGHLLSDSALVVRWGLGLFVFAPVGVVLARRLPPEARGELGGYVLLLGYGLASTASYLGIASESYHQGLWRVEWLLGLYLLLRAGPLLLADRGWPGLRLWAPWLTLLLAVVAGLLAAGGERAGPRDRVAPRTEGPRAAGIALGPNWAFAQRVLAEALGPPGAGPPPSIWSTYAGLLEAEYGVFHPAEDYMIHALGPGARERYVERFAQARPRWVTTIRRSFSPWEEWLQHEHWPFYEEVVRHYDVRAVTRHSLLWERRAGGDAAAPAWDGAVDPPAGASEVALPASDAEDVLVVEVEYRAENARGFVPLLGRLPRYLLAVEGTRERLPVSLPPYQRTWTFAVHRRPGVTPRLQADALALLGGASLSLERVRWRALRLPDSRRRGLLDELPEGVVPTGSSSPGPRQ